MMNKDQISGNWSQLKGEVQRRWGRLTDDQIAEAEGNREKLAGQIQEAYGIAKEEAEQQVREWEKKQQAA